MEFVNYALLSLVSYIGLFCGALLVFIAPEEQKPGVKYFLLMQKIFLILIIILLLYKFSIINLFLAIVLFLFAISKRINNYFVYVLFAPLLYLSLPNKTYSLIIASLIFLYGLPTGSLIVKTKNLGSVKECLRYIYYPILSLLLFALPTLTSYF